jgi:hypothetical protein
VTYDSSYATLRSPPTAGLDGFFASESHVERNQTPSGRPRRSHASRRDDVRPPHPRYRPGIRVRSVTGVVLFSDAR